MAEFQKLIIDGKEVAKLLIDGKQCFPLVLKRNLTVSVSVVEDIPGKLVLELALNYDGPKITLSTSMIQQHPGYSLPSEVSEVYQISNDGNSFFATYTTTGNGYEIVPCIVIPESDGYESDDWAASSSDYWLRANERLSRNLQVGVTTLIDTYGILSLKVDLDYDGPEVDLGMNNIDGDGYWGNSPPSLTVHNNYSATITFYNEDIYDMGFDLIVKLPETDEYFAASWDNLYHIKGQAQEEYFCDICHTVLDSEGAECPNAWNHNASYITAEVETYYDTVEYPSADVRVYVWNDHDNSFDSDLQTYDVPSNGVITVSYYGLTTTISV